MTGGWVEMAAVFAAFLTSHALPARPPARARLVGVLGRQGYLVAYSVVSLALLVWLVIAAGRPPYVPLWTWAPWQTWAPNIAMPIVCLLAAYGRAVPNSLSFGGRDDAQFDPERPGIAGVARHRLLWALALWAGAHAVANAGLAHVLLFGGFAVLGMRFIDRRLQRRLGQAEWTRPAGRTSLLPLEALVAGRWRPRKWPDPRRAAIAVILWAVLFGLHRSVIGVSPLPVI